jgi:hypothetical protein
MPTFTLDSIAVSRERRRCHPPDRPWRRLARV